MGLLVIGTLKLYKDALQSIFGLQFTKWLVAIIVTQYHFMYYLSRPLPNIMAMPLGNLNSILSVFYLVVYMIIITCISYVYCSATCFIWMVETKSHDIYLVICSSNNNIQSRTCHATGIIPFVRYSQQETNHTKVFTYYIVDHWFLVWL